MIATKWLRVTRAEPCTLCGHTQWCNRSADGHVCHCMRVESPKPARNGGWIHRLDKPLQPVAVEDKEPAPRIDASAAARKMFRHPDAEMTRWRLAKQLGVEPWTLKQLGVGVGSDWNGERFASFPSRDATGNTIGIVRRYDDGRKMTLRGTSNAGVFSAPRWWTYPGPVWIVEGASDTAAMLSDGLCVIGRPSNIGGARIIRRMLAKRAAGRLAIVLGENDAKPERRGTMPQCPADCTGCSWCWPGKYGAVTVSRQLKAGWVMPPSGMKDARAWRRAAGITFVNALIGRLLNVDAAKLDEQMAKLDRVAKEMENLVGLVDKLSDSWKVLHETVIDNAARLNGVSEQVKAVDSTQKKLIERLKQRFDAEKAKVTK